MTHHDIAFAYTRKAGVGDAVCAADDLEAVQRHWLTGKWLLPQQPRRAPRERMDARVPERRPRLFGPDGKLLT